MRFWHHLLVVWSIVGVWLVPGVGTALSYLAAPSSGGSRLLDDCCPREASEVGQGEQAESGDGCSLLCVGFCCPIRTLASSSLPPTACLAEWPHFTRGDPTSLAAGFVREIEHPPSR